MKLKILLMLSVLALAGCETSAAYTHTDISRKVVEIDGYKVAVAQMKNGNYQAAGGYKWIETSPDLFAIKDREIRGVEAATGCKVTDAEFLAGTFILQAKVKCG